MRIIALRGGNSTGKTTTLNIVYNDLINKGAQIITPKSQLGGNKKDFESTISYNGLIISFYTMGDFAKKLKEAITKYDNNKIDIFICASNTKFVTPIKLILKHKNNLVTKSLSTSIKNQKIENIKDSKIILNLI